MDIKYKESNSKPLIETKVKSCEICNQSDAFYTCPRCNIHYCSLKCYQNLEKHINCSESFYQEQVIEELKQCKLNDSEERNRMVRILKENIKELENESILPEEDKSDNERENEEVSEEQLVRAYEKEIGKWTPWWRNVNESTFLELPDLSKFNKNLIKNSQKINIVKANPLVGDDIVQLFYVYTVIASVYQLNESEKEFNEEIALNMIQIEKMTKSVISSTAQLQTKLYLTLKNFLEDQSFFLRDYVEKGFLLDMLNEIECLTKSPITVYKFISNLYDALEFFTKTNSLNKNVPQQLSEEKSIEPVLEEKPINVFHFNRVVEKKSHDPAKKSRVQIIYHMNSESEAKSTKLEKSSSSLKETKLMLKRLEFYFKWFQLKQLEFRNSLKSFHLIKTSLVKEYQEVEEHKEFMQNNLEKLRAQIKKSNKNVLIEEISK